jgi:hypothetical protein
MVGRTAYPRDTWRPASRRPAERPDFRIGHFLVMLGVMTAPQVEIVLAAQHAGDSRLFGEISAAMGFVQDNSLRRFADYLDRNDEPLL